MNTAIKGLKEISVVFKQPGGCLDAAVIAEGVDRMLAKGLDMTDAEDHEVRALLALRLIARLMNDDRALEVEQIVKIAQADLRRKHHPAPMETRARWN